MKAYLFCWQRWRPACPGLVGRWIGVWKVCISTESSPDAPASKNWYSVWDLETGEKLRTAGKDVLPPDWFWDPLQRALYSVRGGEGEDRR